METKTNEDTGLDWSAVTSASLERVTRTVSPCDCPTIEHKAMCPENPEPAVCCICAEAFDPDDTHNFEECVDEHCGDCRTECVMCSRQHEFV